MGAAFTGIGRSKVENGKVVEIKEWVRNVLDLDEDTMVLVTELPCTEPGCPPVETAITIIGTDTRAVYTAHGPIGDLDRDKVERSLLG